MILYASSVGEEKDHMPYQLLGSEISYFTGKARAYLRWKGVDFKEVTATRDVYTTTILPRVGWAVIPVMIAPDDTIVSGH